MNAPDPQSLHANEQVDAPQDELKTPANDSNAGPDQSHSATENVERDAELSASEKTGQDEDACEKFGGVDTNKVQYAIENLVRRIAEARSRGAAGGAYASNVFTHSPAESRTASKAPTSDTAAIPEMDWQHEAIKLAEPEAVPSDRRMAALELRMRQIAELAGTPLVEDISADIAALRGRMDRLSRADGALSSRMETIQRQLSGLRETMDTSTTPVIDRLVELEMRFDEIGEALTSRQLSTEARKAVEHSCNHILSAIARIEGVARQAAAPDGAWDQISAVRSQIERLPTAETMEDLEKRIHAVSEQLGDVVNRREHSERLANLERRLLDVGMSTKVAVEEIRERPAYDPADIHTLLQRVESWRREKPQSDLPGVGAKLDTIARQVDQLSNSNNKATLTQIQERLGEISSLVSAQSAKFSGLDLAGLQSQLTRICDELATEQDGRRFDKPTPSAKQPDRQDFAQSHEDDEDRILAKRLAVRFAPQGKTARSSASRSASAADANTNTDDVAGAFDAVQDALESLVGQIPFLERTWDDKDQSRLQEPPAAGACSALASETQPSAQGATVPESGDEKISDKDSLPSGTGGEQERPPSGAVLEQPASAEEKSGAQNTSYGDAAHRIGRYSTWRKAKVAVVAANPPKY